MNKLYLKSTTVGKKKYDNILDMKGEGLLSSIAICPLTSTSKEIVSSIIINTDGKNKFEMDIPVSNSIVIPAQLGFKKSILVKARNNIGRSNIAVKCITIDSEEENFSEDLKNLEQKLMKDKDYIEAMKEILSI